MRQRAVGSGEGIAQNEYAARRPIHQWTIDQSVADAGGIVDDSKARNAARCAARARAADKHMRAVDCDCLWREQTGGATDVVAQHLYKCELSGDRVAAEHGQRVAAFAAHENVAPILGDRHCACAEQPAHPVDPVGECLHCCKRVARCLLKHGDRVAGCASHIGELVIGACRDGAYTGDTRGRSENPGAERIEGEYLVRRAAHPVDRASGIAALHGDIDRRRRHDVL